jgi:hypothetical protein
VRGVGSSNLPVPTISQGLNSNLPRQLEAPSFLAGGKVQRMRTVPSGTIVGYDAASGERLFTEANRATRFPDQTLALPHANNLYTAGDKTYRIAGVRKGSTETRWEIDVIEEPSGSDQQGSQP